MKNFADEALVLMPKPEVYEDSPVGYREKLRKAVTNVINYLHKCNIQTRCLCTDEVSLSLNIEDTKWIQTLNDADKFFIVTHNTHMSVLKYLDLIKYPELYKASAEKFPIVGKLNADQRFEVLVKRENYVSKEIINRFKVVVTFEQKSDINYKVVSKEGDGRICIIIDNRTFIPKCLLSGNEVDPNDLLNFSGANRPVYSWEV